MPWDVSFSSRACVVMRSASWPHNPDLSLLHCLLIGALVHHWVIIVDAALGVQEAGAADDRPVPTSEAYLASLPRYHPADEDLAEQAQCSICLMQFAAEDHMHVSTIVSFTSGSSKTAAGTCSRHHYIKAWWWWRWWLR